MKTGDEDYDLRVSIVPTKYGEAVCLRILGRQSLLLDLVWSNGGPGEHEAHSWRTCRHCITLLFPAGTESSGEPLFLAPGASS